MTFNAFGRFTLRGGSSIGAWMRSNIVAALLCACTTHAIAQSVEDFGAPRIVNLFGAKERIYPGGAFELVAVRENFISIVNIVSGAERARINLDRPPAELLPFREESGDWMVSALIDGPDGYTVRDLNIDEGLATQRIQKNAVPLGMQEPMIRHLFGSLDHQRTVVWDAALDQMIYSYRILGLEKATDVGTKWYPFDLRNVTSSDYMLGLQPRLQSASLINVEDGVPLDDIFVGELFVNQPSDLAVFVPNEPSGGTGEVLAVNQATQMLSLFSLDTTRRMPRLAPPIHISLKNFLAAAPGPGRLLLAADGELGYIVVGRSGSDRLAVFRRVGGSFDLRMQRDRKTGGGIEELGIIRLQRPIRDIAVIDGLESSTSDTFVFLREDGRSLEVVPDMSRLLTPEHPEKLTSAFFDNVEFRPSERPRLQRVLAALGYPIGAIDGVLGPATRAAIRAFQIDKQIEPSGTVDDKTILALNSAVEKIIRLGGSKEADFEAYRSFLKEKAPGVSAEQMLMLGSSHRSPGSSCFGLNSLPPRELWGNSLGFANVFKQLKERKGLNIEIVSGYRTAAYGRCSAGGDKGSYHLLFQAFDIRLLDGGSDGKKRLVQALHELRDAGVFSGGIGPLGVSVHIDTRGTNVDFGQITED